MNDLSNDLYPSDIKFEKLLRSFYPQTDLKLIFQYNISGGSYFKNQICTIMKSNNIVYKFSLSLCNATYVGVISIRILLNIKVFLLEQIDLLKIS